MPPFAKTIRTVVAVIVVLGAGVAIRPLDVDAAPAAPDDPREERERVRQDRAQVAADLDVLQATNVEVERALIDVTANVTGQQAAVADATRAAEQAEVAAQQAREVEAATLAEMQLRQGELRDLAVQAYVSSGTDDPSLTALESDDIGTAVQRQALVGFRAGEYSDVVDALDALSEDLTVARDQAERSSAEAAGFRSEVETRLDELEVARDQQAAVAVEVDTRIEAALAESAVLADLDASLARQIAEEQARLAAAAAAAAASAASAAAEAARTRPSSSGGGSSGGSTSSGGGGGSTARTTSPPRPVGNVTLQTVRGISVASSIADQLDRMMGAAEAAGLVLGGGGYRSSDAQIRLRQQNCPDVYDSSPSSCSPPTARPGASNHERGLAVDFTCDGGGTIRSRSSPCFVWLDANAASYG
ncbi:MAG: M15 family metallopeptidase, partial [Acidimicrobiales bacterium]